MPSLKEIESARTEGGGWTKETLAGWGIPWPPPKGWKAKLAGRTFTRARASDGSVVKGIYLRDGQFHAGYSVNGSWKIKQLKADNLDDARIERKRILQKSGGFVSHELRRPPEPRLKQLDRLHNESRQLAQAVSNAKLLLAHRENRALLDEAEWMVGRAAELIFAAWRTSR